MGNMVYSLFWVVQDLYHQPYYVRLLVYRAFAKSPFGLAGFRWPSVLKACNFGIFRIGFL